MADEPKHLKIGELKPGMGVDAITGFSSEYSYLDTKRVEMLRQQFRGSQFFVERGGRMETVGTVGLRPGDNLKAIKEIPVATGFGNVTSQMVEFLQNRGFLTFLAQGEGATPAPQPATPALEATPRAAADGKGAVARMEGAKPAPGQQGTRTVTDILPQFQKARGMEHIKRVAETRYFLEQIEESDQERGNSSEILKEMFEQGQAGNYSVRPATEAVERILFKDASRAMAAVSGLKGSDQTYAHCVDMAVIFNEAAQGMIRATGKPTSEKMARSTMVAGFMHDIGKSKIPKDILDSTQRFAPDSREMELMRSHVVQSAQILSDAGMDETMINIAHFHHVKKDTSLPSSYPQVAYSEVSQLTRLAAIVDVYQALTGRRSYKKNWVPGTAIQYLLGLQGSEFDESMLKQFIRVMGKFPVGSLVALSTGDLAFVTKVEGQPFDKPVVAVVENGKGELLSAHPIVDLKAEEDLSITDVVDHFDHYSESPNQSFDIFKALKPM